MHVTVHIYTLYFISMKGMASHSSEPYCHLVESTKRFYSEFHLRQINMYFFFNFVSNVSPCLDLSYS